MKYAIIDIGSNSVRLLISDGVSSLKEKINTRLAEGMGEGVLTENAIKRTANAVAFFNKQAKSIGADKVCAFATAAVRNSVNGKQFVSAVKSACGLDVDVLSGEQEAQMGYVGALGGKNGGLIDVGGASSEIIVVKGGKVVYGHSLDIGAVRVKDVCGQDKSKNFAFVNDRVKEYGVVPHAEFYAIGGTATSVAAMLLGLKKYERAKIDGFFVSAEKLNSLSDELFSLSVEERKKMIGLEPQRAEIIAGGVCILVAITKMLNINGFTVSESDNLEGYLKVKVLKK